VATLPSPRTWTASEQVTAAKLNTDLRDNFNFYKAPPLARLRKSGNQSIPAGAITAVTWDQEILDRDAGHSTTTNTSRYTAQTAGYYHLRACVVWALNTANNPDWIDMYFRRNGSTIYNRTVYVVHEDFFDSPQIAEGFVDLTVGDYVEVVVLTLNAPGAINVVAGSATTFSSFETRWIGSP
jgi:hypothetical protein